MGYPFGQLGLAVLPISPTNLLPLPTPAYWPLGEEGGGWVVADSLDALRALLSNSQSIGVLSTLF